MHPLEVCNATPLLHPLFLAPHARFCRRLRSQLEIPPTALWTRPVGRAGATENAHFRSVALKPDFVSVRTSWSPILANPGQGLGKDYCAVPNLCQSEFGRCDSDATPTGYNMSADDRDYTGVLTFGTVISNCKIPRVIALTYDDGPSENTEELLDVLKEAGAKATFFVSGNNNGKGEIDRTPRWTRAIKRMAEEGHQIASHTWSHADLDKMSSDLRKVELLKNERALANILNKYPTYMRPPYLRCKNETGCLGDMRALGYHVISYSYDSADWMHGTDLAAMTAAFDRVLEKVEAEQGRMLLIQHDTIRTSAIGLTRYVLGRVSQRGWRGMCYDPSRHNLEYGLTYWEAVTVGECLGDGPNGWYRMPQWITPFSTAEHGCIVFSEGFCGTLDKFKTKVECFRSNVKCYKQVDRCKEGSVEEATCQTLKRLCNAQYLFCAQCERSETESPACTIEQFNVFDNY